MPIINSGRISELNSKYLGQISIHFSHIYRLNKINRVLCKLESTFGNNTLSNTCIIKVNLIILSYLFPNFIKISREQLEQNFIACYHLRENVLLPISAFFLKYSCKLLWKAKFQNYQVTKGIFMCLIYTWCVLSYQKLFIIAHTLVSIKLHFRSVSLKNSIYSSFSLKYVINMRSSFVH